MGVLVLMGALSLLPVWSGRHTYPVDGRAMRPFRFFYELKDDLIFICTHGPQLCR